VERCQEPSHAHKRATRHRTASYSSQGQRITRKGAKTFHRLALRTSLAIRPCSASHPPGLSPRQRALRSLLRYPQLLGLKAFHSVSHLAWYQALFVPIVTMDRNLASHPVNPPRSIQSLPTRVRLMFPAHSSSSHGVSGSSKSGLLDTFADWRST
jgi:hypothetical protein